MAVKAVIPEPLGNLAPVAPNEANTWGQNNGKWIKKVLDEHQKFLKDEEIAKYQAAYDGYYESIEDRDKNRGDDINNKLFVNYAQQVIETVVDYLLGEKPSVKVETEDEVSEDLVDQYRQDITDILNTKTAYRVIREFLTQGSIAGYSATISWVNENGEIDLEEYPAQEVIPIYNTRNRLIMVIRKYEIELPNEKGNLTTKTRVEVYDDRYVTYYISDETGSQFELDDRELETGNPYEHKAGRIPVAIFTNGTPARYEKRKQRNGVSDLGNGVYSLLEEYAHKMSDKSNLVEYLLDQYLLLKGVDTDEEEVQKMRKARALVLKHEDSDAEFISQDQDDQAVENHLDRVKDSIHDTTFTPNINDMEGKTAYEIKMKHKGLETKASKKETYFLAAIDQIIEVITDFLNHKRLLEAGVQTQPDEEVNDAIHEILKGNREAGIELYNPEWVEFELTYNLPQNYTDIANIVATLAGKVPDKYLYSLLWFVDDPQKALDEMKEQREDRAKESMNAMGFSNDFQGTGNPPQGEGNNQEGGNNE